MPDYRTPVSSPSQKAPVRVSVDQTQLDIEVVSADGAALGRPYILAIVLNGLVVGWRLSFEPMTLPEVIVTDIGPEARSSDVERWFRLLAAEGGAA